MSSPTRPKLDPVLSILSTASPDGSVRCGVCAHRCLVRPGRRGICGVRENRGGQLWCEAYGAVAATGVDPIEKKPLFHVDPGTLAYSISTAGCPFHCTFCQNWQIAQAPRLGIGVPVRRRSPAQIVDDAGRAGAGSIAYTYVEPTVFLEYALDIGRLAREAGLRNLFVTDGYATPEAIGLLAGVLDAANVDLKSFDDAFYRRLCGARLGHVLEAIVALRAAGVWLEITTLVIPGHNDGDVELRALTRWIVETLGPGTPWHVSRFFPAFRMPDLPATPRATLERAASIGRAAGLRYVYVGNAPDLHLEDTRCPACDALLVERRGYRTRSHLAGDGACPGCGRDRGGPLGGRDAEDDDGEVRAMRVWGTGGARTAVRRAAVAGMFYPASRDALRVLVDELFTAAARLPDVVADPAEGGGRAARDPRPPRGSRLLGDPRGRSVESPSGGIRRSRGSSADGGPARHEPRGRLAPRCRSLGDGLLADAGGDRLGRRGARRGDRRPRAALPGRPPGPRG